VSSRASRVWELAKFGASPFCELTSFHELTHTKLHLCESSASQC